MNSKIEEILKDLDKDLSLLENIVYFVKKNSIEIDDIAEVIKNDKTLYNMLYDECKSKGLLKENSKNELKLSGIF